MTPMRAVLLSMLWTAAACSESFLPPSAVVDLRAVAARVVVDGKPGRANPDPEDEIEVSWLVIDEGRLPELQWAFVACIPAPTRFGTPICQDVITPCEGCDATPPENPLALPVIRFQVPTEAELEAAEATSVLVQGAICANGPPGLASIDRFIRGETDDIDPCEDPDNEGRFVTTIIPIEIDDTDPNLHPTIADVRLEGAPWPPPYDQGVRRSAPQSGCSAEIEMLPESDQERHPVAGSQPSTIGLSVPRESLQPFTVAGVEEIEEIQVSWLADGGGFDTSFSFISDPDFPSILTAWRPPPVDALPTPDSGGLLVRFNFVIRDGRGGVDFVERGLCVRPPNGE